MQAGAKTDRARLRIRARFEVKFLPASRWTIGLRLRSGSTASQQSPHITIADFDGNPRGDAGAVFDKYYTGPRPDAQHPRLLLPGPGPLHSRTSG